MDNFPINVENLTFTYPSGVQALRGIDLTIEPHSRLAIIGANGSGKTTLVKHLNGLHKPTSGTVSIGDWRTSDYSISKLALRVGYVFQNPDDQLFKSSISQEIAYGPTRLGLPAEQVQERVEAAMDLLELRDKADEHPADCPFPWRKRIALASVIAMNPPILIFDEPTTGQDAHSINLLVRVIEKLHQQGKTIIMISHDMELVAENFEHIIAMEQGRIILSGTPEEVFAQEDVLQRTSVNPPQITRLGHRLHMPQTVCTTDAFIDELTKLASKRI